MDTRKAKLTRRTVEAAPLPPPGGETRVWDTELKGLFVRVLPGGTRTYALKYRVGPVQRILKLGVHSPAFRPEDARDAAMEALREVSANRDPAETRKEARNALTVGQLIDAYVSEGPATKPGKRASTWANDASNLNRHFRPLLGSKVANAVTRADVAKAFTAVCDGKTACDEKTGPRGRAIVKGGEAVARRTRTTAAAMYAWGLEHGRVKVNPFAGMKLPKAVGRERFLSREEAARLLDALTALEASGEVTDAVADVIRLLLLTGARKSEIAALTWREVDFERRRLVLPPERTKAGGKTGERRIALSPPALEILSQRQPANVKGNEYVFPSTRGDGPVVLIRRPFLKACARAGLEGVRLHDLRHSFASFLVADGASLFLVSKLLGHAGTAVTERYAHLAGDPLDDAAAAVGKKLFPSVLEKRGEVVSLR